MRCAAAMRKGRVLAEADKDSSRYTQGAKSSLTISSKLILRHTFAHTVVRSLVCSDSDVICALHQCQFRWRLEHPAAGSHRSGTHKLQRRRDLANSVKKKKPHALFYADGPGANTPISQDLSNTLVRTLVFFPGTDVLSDFDEFARTFFFKLWANPTDLTAHRNHHGKHSFTRSPAHACKISHTGPGFDIDGLNTLFLH